MPYRIRCGDAVVECDTAKEAIYLVGAILRQKCSERSAGAKTPPLIEEPMPEAAWELPARVGALL